MGHFLCHLSYVKLNKEFQTWIRPDLSTAVYTQTADVEIEINEYLSYDREDEIMDFDLLREMNTGLTKWQGKKTGRKIFSSCL